MNDLKTLAWVDAVNLIGWIITVQIDTPSVQSAAIYTALVVNVLTIGKLLKNTFFDNTKNQKQ